jgi:hypothetical protein
MLIFDRFPSDERAREFVAHIEATFDRKAWVFSTQDESDASDPFPFVLEGPIVHVERFEDYSAEDSIIASVRSFDGSFAGT